MSRSPRTKITPPDPSWLRRLRERGFTVRTVFDAGQHEDLKRVLLSFGGVAVVLPVIEEDKHILMRNGQCYVPKGRIMRRGQPCRCHTNSAFLWRANSELLKIATGYAMCNRGVWRQHTWCLMPKGADMVIVETTTKPLLYFGAQLTPKQARRFVEDQIF